MPTSTHSAPSTEEPFAPNDASPGSPSSGELSHSELSHSELSPPDKSVNLYSILELSPDVGEEVIRRRINDLFAEAQKNIDHRNFRRRFYYQELFEIHLPQARFHLLDDERRRDYNSALSLNVLPSASRPSANPNLDALPSLREEKPIPTHTNNLDLDALPSVVSAEMPEVRPAFSFEMLTESDAPATPTAPATLATNAVPQVSRQTPARDATSIVAPSATAEISEKATEELQRERRRDLKRRELIKHELMAVGTQWAIIGAVAASLLGLSAWIFARRSMAINDWRFDAVSLLICCAAMLLAGRAAHREARRRTVALLSQMPYTQLLRRCMQK